MNQHLQAILNFIQQAKHLSDEEKTALLKDAKAADKELEITAFKLERTEKVKHTTAILLEETIEELEQKRKAVEAQNKELEIEAALEKVRSRSLAMHKSDELWEVIAVVFEKFQELNFAIDGAAFITTFIEGTREQNAWVAGNDSQPYPTSLRLPYLDSPVINDIWQAKESGLHFLSKTYSVKEKNHWLRYAFENTGLKSMTDEWKNWILEQPFLTQTLAFGKTSMIGIHFHHQKTLTETEVDILKRFSKVFDQAYIRFLDLQKAEAQAREAQIEAALEKIRGRSLAMHKTDELKDVINIVFEKLVELNIVKEGIASIFIYRKGSKDIDQWAAAPDLFSSATHFRLPYFDQPVNNEFWEAKEKGMEFFIKTIPFEEKNRMFEWLFEHSDYKYLSDDAKKWLLGTESFTRFDFFGKNSSIFIPSYTKQLLSEFEIDTLKRIAKVFEQTYTRFLDLQKAEAQARESQIQLAMERVRARTMAMQKSDELGEAAQLLFQIVGSLEVSLWTCGFFIWNDDRKTAAAWMGSEQGILSTFNIPNDEYIFLRFYEAAQRGESLHVLELTGEAIETHYKYMLKIPVAGDRLKNITASGGTLPAIQILHAAYFTQGYLLFITYAPVPEAWDIFKRFAKVFEQTYTRFLDLEKAEAYAREAQIELGLERVRARAMAMHGSDELKELVKTLFEELIRVDVNLSACLISTFDISTLDERSWMFHPVTREPYVIQVPYNEQPFYHEMLRAWKERNTAWNYCLEGETKVKWHDFLFSDTEFAFLPQSVIDEMRRPDKVFFTASYYSYGAIQVASLEPFPAQSIDIIQRFSKVFDLSYTRFLDLQKAEAQARDSQIELALERVRARTMAMQRSDELREAVLVIYEQLQQLNFESKACNIIIIDKESGSAQYWVSGFSQEIFPESYTVPYLDHPYQDELLKPWKRGDKYVVYEYTGKMKQSFDEIFFTKTEFRNVPEDAKKVMIGLKSVMLSTAFISCGALQALGAKPLSEEDANILQRFAKVFEQTYTRFLDLQKAEAQAREAQIQLALERVRARTMAMQKSDELTDAASLLFKQIADLDIKLWSTAFQIWNADDISTTAWPSAPDGSIQAPFRLPYTEDIFFKRIYEARQSGKDFFVMESSGKELEETYHYMFNLPGVKKYFDDALDSGFAIPKFQITHCAFFAQGYVMFITYEPVTEMHDIFKRFAKVFEQTYTRFLDLQKAEEQAREAQIELGLERVRARAMAMQHSDELKELIGTVYNELTKLDLAFDRCLIWVMNREDLSSRLWMANAESQPVNFYIPHHDNPPYLAFVKAWKDRNTKWQYDLHGQLKKEWDGYVFTQTEMKHLPDPVKKNMQATDRVIFAASFHNFGCLQTAGPELLKEEQFNILNRFAKVFDLTYTRFNDLKQAEAQAREAQIELGLERVRARAMAMQKSDELSELVDTVFKELTKLDFALTWCIINIIDESSLTNTVWAANPGINKAPESYHMLFEDYPFHHAMMKGWKERKTKSVYTLEGDEKRIYDDYLFSETEFKRTPEAAQAASRAMEKYVVSFSFSNFGGLQTVGDAPLSEANLDILSRFGKVFDLTYTRFNDLKQAEAQARESQIQLALERVRARTMAMQKSAEIGQAAALMFQQVQSFGVLSFSCGFNIWEPDDISIMSYMSSPDGTFEYISGRRLPHTEHPFFIKSYEARKRGEDFFVFETGGKDLEDTYRYMFSFPDWKSVFEEWKNSGFPVPPFQISHYVFFQQGYLLFITYEPVPEMHDIFKRFGKVFEQTYTRFLDLQKAESQARESQIEASLERVRARAMAMQKSDELKELIGTVFIELTKLDLVLTRCLIMIYDIKTNGSTWWMANSEAPSDPIGLFIKYHGHLPYLAYINAWQERNLKWQYILEGAVKKEWDDFLFVETELSLLPDFVIEGMKAPDRVYLNASFNSFGNLTLASLEPLSDEHFDILLRFAKVFDLTYTRFNDLKQAEAQAREAKIEAALERVRAQTMAMHNSEDVTSATETMFEELKKLGIDNLRCGIANIHHNRTFDVFGVTNLAGGDKMSGFGLFGMDEHPIWRRWFESWKNKEEVFIAYLAGQDKEEYFNNINNHRNYLPQQIINIPDNFFQAYYFEQGSVWAYSLLQHSEPEKDIMKRFATGFSLTFRRYQDLKQAEAQAREAMIEAGLERVRSRTMAMFKSDELAETAAVVFKQLIGLGIAPNRSYIAIINDTSGDFEFWITDENGDKLGSRYIVNINKNISIRKMYEGWAEKKKSIIIVQQGKELEDWLTYWKEEFHVSFKPGAALQRRVQIIAYFSKGFVAIASPDDQPESTINLLERFAAVFNLTYTRFSDLQQAEAQAREAQIEVALERVRARTMAMHSSEDVSAATATMFIELEKLGIENFRGGITNILSNRTQEVWSVNNLVEEKSVKAVGIFKMDAHPFWQYMYKEWEAKKNFLHYHLTGQDKVDYIKILNTTQGYLPQAIQEFPDVHFQVYFFNEGAVWTNSLQPHSEEDKQVMKRFASVFSLTFRRYQDLKKAEAQAREATIEAALEKVRGKAMAMHNSNDLSVTASTVFTELRKLGITPIRCGVGLLNKKSHKAQLYSATSSADGDQLSLVGWVQLENHPVLEKIYDSWRQQYDYFPELQGEGLRSYYQLLLAGLSVAVPDTSDNQNQYGHFLPFSVGCLYAWSDTPYNETEIKILKRFASIIDLTFRRYIELQKSEANAREAIKQAALDRVRAEIASMRTVTDLDKITPLIWNELNILGVPFIRCGVFLMDDSQKLIHTFLSTPDGKAIAAFHLTYDTPGNFAEMVRRWHSKQIYIDHWGETEFISMAETLVKQGAITTKEQYLNTLPGDGFYLHFLPFLQGMLYVGNTTQLGEEEVKLIQSVADAFSTAYARYEDFNKLESAKQQIEKTLVDLKQAQAQLVQSEKMASLGELTAGIAHEIQNPLNFVNNFSEVSNELIEEMNEELDKGDIKEAKAIAADIQQNLEKINHHGKRADAIVKGMLQHSRSSSATKEATDINKLADEYLRLAYHGLRAKDKSFNATMITDYDETIGNINIIPQDIGRVILNLIMNAFYTVTEKKKQAHDHYEPTVSLTTKKINDKIEIKICDNGNGIPGKVIDKIFQPFFTTKPTGQGTGLGLSLAYDIIKTHNGELKVDTKEGEGSEFIIQLPV